MGGGGVEDMRWGGRRRGRWVDELNLDRTERLLSGGEVDEGGEAVCTTLK